MAKDNSHTGDEELVERESKRLGARIKALRISKGFKSSEKFANEKGFARPQYARYEKGKNIEFQTLVKLVNALDMSLKEFFSEGFD
jgi:transcriptional regulator with XRE-family HTH domain